MITISAFKEWLATKDPNESFRYSDNYNCVVAQFYKQTQDKPDVFVGVDRVWPYGIDGIDKHPIPVEIMKPLLDMDSDVTPFGAVQRLFGVRDGVAQCV